MKRKAPKHSGSLSPLFRKRDALWRAYLSAKTANEADRLFKKHQAVLAAIERNFKKGFAKPNPKRKRAAVYTLRKTYFRGSPRFGRTTTLLKDGKVVLELMGVVPKRAAIAQYEDRLKPIRESNPSQVARVQARGGKRFVVATDSKESDEQLLNRVNAVKVLKRVNTNPDTSKRGSLFSAAMIEKLRAEYIKTPERVDPDSPTLLKMRALLRKASNAQVKQLRDARIRWVSVLANTELVRREAELEQALRNPSSPVNEWDDEPFSDDELNEAAKQGWLGAGAMRREHGKRAVGPKYFKVTWYSPLRGKRTGFLQPIEAHTAAEAKRQAKAMVENDPKASNFVAKEIARNPKRRKTRGAGGVYESSAYSKAASLGYPYVRGDGKVASNGETWLNRFTKTYDGKSPAIYVGFDDKKKTWIVEHENPSAVGEKIAQLVSEGTPRKQAVAIAFSEKRAGKINPADLKLGPVTLLQSFWGHRPGTKGVIVQRGGEYQLMLKGSQPATVYASDVGVLFRYLKRKRNPSTREMSERFNGHADGSVIELKAANGAPSDLSRGGKLVLLKLADKSKALRIPGAVVTIDPKTERLWIAGDRAPLLNRKAKPGQRLNCGEIDRIIYETAKRHIGKGKTFEYDHKFGENGGRKPSLYIDADGMPLIVGGDYKIRPEGIVN